MQSANFYQKVFGWHLRQRKVGSTSFDDSVTGVCGTWVIGRQPYNGDSLMIYIMVKNAEETILSIIDNGGTITRQIGADFAEVSAKFSDPADNIMSIYQQSGL